MATSSELLAIAIQQHQEGQLRTAEQIYRQVLQAEPAQADALHLLGLIAHQTDRHESAIELIGQAIAVKPNVATFHFNLAGALTAAHRIPDAIACYRRAIELKPNLAEAHGNLGDLFRDMGWGDDAIACYRRALALKPDDAERHNNLGNCFRDRGMLNDAVASYRRALQLMPDLWATLLNLGIVHRERGEFDQSIACCRQALDLQPDLAEGQYNLGLALVENGQVTEAVAAFQRAIDLKPNYAEAYNGLGIAFQHLKQPDDAVHAYRRSLELNPDNPRTLNNLGTTLRDQWKLDEAIACYRRAIELSPNYAIAHTNLGYTLKQQDKLVDAVGHYRRAIELDPDLAEAHFGLGMAYHDIGKLSEAATCFLKALELKPDFVEAHYNLGNIFDEQGKRDEAAACFQRTLELNARYVPAMVGLARSRRAKLDDTELHALEDLMHIPRLPAHQRAMVQFGLAQVHDARGQFARAAEYLVEANRIQQDCHAQRHQGYDSAEHHAHISHLIENFSPAYFNRVSGWGLDTERPVFIVGMPRSGTTLTEQILASHPQVHGAGECLFAAVGWERLAQALGQPVSPIDHLGEITPDVITQIAEWHLARLDQVAGPGPLRVVDKMPDNYQLLGWIATLFPRARIIHCRRDVRDVALSCWITNFGRIRWSNDLDHLADRILDYQRIMAHFERVLPLEMFPVDYEEMVADQEGVSRRLLEFVGLEWSPACLNYHQTDRQVRTASLTQVRQPIYSSSVGRWKHYATVLAPLLRRLEAANLVK